MSWTNFFDEIYCINLPKRTDRLLEFTEEAEKYNIQFKLIDGIEHPQGAEGLRLTVEGIFKNAIEKNYEHILIFEDDCLFVNDPNSVMNEVIKQLPQDYHILYLGAQPTNGFHYRHSANLLQLDGAYATHAWALSVQGIKEILSQPFYAPIDNCIVAGIQKLQKCYITYPLLATQRAGVSNIGGEYIEWDVFITPRYNQKLAELK